MNCDWAKAVWFGSPLTINFNHLNKQSNFTDWITTMLKKSDDAENEKIAAIIYHIWNARNRAGFAYGAREVRRSHDKGGFRVG
jgi:hypothetical protein